LTAGFQSEKEIEMAPTNRKAAPRRSRTSRPDGNPLALAPSDGRDSAREQFAAAEASLYRVDALARAVQALLEKSEFADDEPGQHTLALLAHARTGALRLVDVLDAPELLADACRDENRIPFEQVFDLQAHAFAALAVFEHCCEWESDEDGSRALNLLQQCHAATREAFAFIDHAATTLPPRAEAA